MANTQYSLNWDAFQSSMCSGFSSFQQSGEFVDMTLAADGHMVKVHQIVMALASPFLKGLIHNAQCPHPVIYLNNVKHATLCNILEYIYTGEVLVEAQNFSEFIQAAKGLHIRGLDTVSSTGEDETHTEPQRTPQVHPLAGVKRTAMQSNIGLKELSKSSKKLYLKNEQSGNFKTDSDDMFSYEDSAVTPRDDDAPDWAKNNEEGGEAAAAAAATVGNLQFTVSNRGQLQVILNRFLYNLHSTAHHAGQRRWRCVDYRSLRCPAFVVTRDNQVLSRSNLHNHSFHDKKILSKVDRKCIFAAIDEVKGVKATNQKEADTTAEDDDESFAA